MQQSFHGRHIGLSPFSFRLTVLHIGNLLRLVFFVLYFKCRMFCSSGVLQSGVRRIVNQVVTPRIDVEIKPKVARVVCEYLGLNPDDIHPEDEEYDGKCFHVK